MLNKNILLLLSKRYSNYIKLLSEHVNVDYLNILDNDIDDDLMLSNNFISLTKTIKSPCAWEKAFYFIKKEQLYNNYNYFYFIEDDVFFK